VIDAIDDNYENIKSEKILIRVSLLLSKWIIKILFQQ